MSVNPMILFVGLDVSSFDIKVCFLNGEGDELKAFTVENDLPGATQLRDEILQAVQGKYVTELRIGLESTSVYSFHPRSEERRVGKGCVYWKARDYEREGRQEL